MLQIQRKKRFLNCTYHNITIKTTHSNTCERHPLLVLLLESLARREVVHLGTDLDPVSAGDNQPEDNIHQTYIYLDNRRALLFGHKQRRAPTQLFVGLPAESTVQSLNHNYNTFNNNALEFLRSAHFRSPSAEALVPAGDGELEIAANLRPQMRRNSPNR